MKMLLLAFVAMVVLLSAAMLLASKPNEDQERLRARFQAVRGKDGEGGGSAEETLLKQVRRQTRGRLAAVLRRLTAAMGLNLLLQQANSSWTAKQLLGTAAVAGLVAGLAGLVFLPLPVLALAPALMGSYLPFAMVRMLRKRRVAAFEKSLPDVIETMSRSLRAGHSLVAAISIVAESAPEPARSEFSEVFRKQNFGLPLREALMQLLDRVPSQDLRVLVTGILLQKETGGNLTQILDRISTLVRERLKLRGEIRVHTAQGRMTGWILSLLPVVMVLLINLVDPGYSRVLTDDPFGRKILYTGAGMLLVGIFVIRRIVTGIEA